MPISTYNNLTQLIDFFHQLPTFGEGFSLEPFKKLLVLLGNPEQKLRGIQIVGSNGKGSTAAHCVGILWQTRLKVGFYCSPHILSYRERIQIDGEWITEESFADVLHHLKSLVEKHFAVDERRPTWFEILTAAAFLHFSEQHCDIVILEAGLGGRLDATTLARKDAVIFTSISKEHTAILGETIEAITEDKAQAIRPENIVVFPDTLPPQSQQIIENQCRKVKAHPTKISPECIGTSWQGTEFTFLNCTNGGKPLRTALIGIGQATNAALAVATCKMLSEPLGYTLTDEKVRKGLLAVQWPCRFEVFTTNETPLCPRGVKIILDGAHNSEGIDHLVSTLQKIGLRPEASAIIFQCMKDKTAQPMVTALKKITPTIIFPTTLDILPRATKARELSATIPESLLGGDYKTTLQLATDAIKGRGVIIICGSLYLAGQWRKFLTRDEETAGGLDSLLMNTDAQQFKF
ncbi:MAG: folylpolyglutamate synthase/dihydrofolate synthase family protein [bacterium]